MKKRAVLLLLILTILLSVFSISAFADEVDKPWYYSDYITLMNFNGSSSYKFTIDHSSKTAVFYGSHPLLVGIKAELTGAEEGTSVTVINPANGNKLTILPPALNAVNFKISKEGETDVIYKGYFIPDGHGFCSASYSVSATTAIKDIAMKKGTTAYTSDVTQENIPPDATAKASHLQLNGFLGEITSASPENAVTVSGDKKSATVNWYQANSTIHLALKWTQNGEEKETTISITDRRVSKLNYTRQQTHGQILCGYAGSKPCSGDTITWLASPEEGYKLDKFTVTGAEGQSVNYTMDATDPNMMSLPIPYDEFTVSASFVPLAEGDKSSIALLKSFTIGGRTATPDSNNRIVIEGMPKSTEFSTLTPTFVLSKGASVDGADTLTFEPNVQKTITVRAENGINIRKYYITITQMQLDGEGTLNASRLKGGSLVVDISLTKVTTGGDTTPIEPMYGDWTSFRGNNDNNGVTTVKTPLSQEESHVQWAISAGMPTPPILLDGKVYVHVGKQIRKIDPGTGKVLQTSEQLADSSQFAMNPLAYGEHMIFVLLGSGSRARVQALDADTLESLWISEEIRGQNISPLTYHDGYLYAGTWNSETADGTYYCLSATDEDPKRPDEIKKTSWTVTHAGGFYWAGAYATDDYVIFGSDNGKNGYTEAGAVLYSVNAKTGQMISSLSKDIIGDIRSTVVHDGNSVYFTTKAGYFYRATVEENGQLRDLKSFKMAGMSTGTPVICGDVAFVSCSGASQFSDSGKLYAVDTATMEKIAEISTPGYVQSSLLVSNAYQAEENTLYIYATYNKMPGGLYLLKYQLNQKTFSGEDLFVPEGTQAQYNICSPICDAEGTIYFKNDSGYLFAVACGARDKAAVKVEETINALPDADQLTLENKEAVAAARAAFDALHETQQAQVSKAAQDKLAAAEAAIAKLEAAEADKAAAAKVEETINALPAAADITLENKEAVVAARAAYDALTEAQQALVSKNAQDKLAACEARIAELEKPADLPFTDLTQDWYMDSIRYVYEHELMYGTTDTTFAPDDALTRGMFVTMLYRMEGKPEVTGNTSFADVPEGAYYADAVAWANANGVVYGTSETAFSPEGKITREQMAAMMRRYASFKKLDVTATTDLAGYSDAATVSSWAIDDMKWAVASELLYGNTRNQLQPTANATRAQAAAILQRFATKIVK